MVKRLYIIAVIAKRIESSKNNGSGGDEKTNCDAGNDGVSVKTINDTQAQSQSVCDGLKTINETQAQAQSVGDAIETVNARTQSETQSVGNAIWGPYTC